MDNGELLERLKTRVGRTAATLVVEDDSSQRHFIGEVTLAAAALYLLSKYLDGFVEGLGIKELGKEHAHLMLLTLDSAKEYVTHRSIELAQLLSGVARALLPHRETLEAKAKAEESVFQTLTQRGVLDSEAREIAAGMTEDLFFK